MPTSNFKPRTHGNRRGVRVALTCVFRTLHDRAASCSRNLQVARSGLSDGHGRNLKVAATMLPVCETFGLGRFLRLIGCAVTLLFGLTARVYAHQGSSS